MNTNLNKNEEQAFFHDLFENRTKEQEIDNEARMLHFRIMQLIEKAMDKRDWNKKNLAEKLGKSQSYLTQLFLGQKMININMMASIQDALDLNFKIETDFADETSYFWKLKKTLPSKNEDIKQEENTQVCLSDSHLEKGVVAA